VKIPHLKDSLPTAVSVLRVRAWDRSGCKLPEVEIPNRISERASKSARENSIFAVAADVSRLKSHRISPDLACRQSWLTPAAAIFQRRPKSIALLLGLICLALTQPKAFGGAVARLAAPGLATMAHPELLPLFLPDGTETRQSSSYDSSGSNNDGNYKTAYTRYIDTNGEYVIFDASGPGCLYRQQINVWSRGRKKMAGLAHIKYYFDNESKPRVDMTIDDLFGGKKAPFTKPFAFLDPRLRFGNLYYPFVFKKHLTVTTTSDFSKLFDTNGCWYQYTYLTYADTNGVASWAGPKEDSPEVRSQWTHLGLDPKPTAGNVAVSNTVSIPKGNGVVLAQLHGAGSITSLKFKLDPYGRKEFYHAILRIYWDGAKRPAVDMPLGLFFGGGGETYPNCRRVSEMSLHTLFYGFNGTNHDFYCYWPMPYWHSARVELVNKSGEDLKSVSCMLQYKPASVLDYPEGKAGYFCALHTLARAAGHGLFNTVFETSGRGKVVGISFYSYHYAMDGDEFSYMDGSRTPQIHGDGTEDDHNQGFGGDAYQKALWGGLINGYQGAYRLYYNDFYIFNQHIKINYEFSREGGFDNGGDTEAVVYYFKGASVGHLLLTDELDVGDPVSEAAHDYTVAGQIWQGTRQSGYDGYERDYEYDYCQDNGRAFDGSSEFTVAISPANHGVELRRRLYRCGDGEQQAIVYVDGVPVKERPWDVCTYSCAPAYQGWYDADFEIPAAYTQGKSKLHLRVQNAGGTNSEINEFYYWVYCFEDHPAIKTPPVRELSAKPVGSCRVDLQWSPAPVADQVNYYRVERSEQPDFAHPTLLGRSNASHFNDSRVKPSTTYHYRVAAVGLSGAVGPFSKTVEETTGRDIQESTAVFLGIDDTTEGNWAGKYGSDGFIMTRYFWGRNCQVYPDCLCAVEYDGFISRQFASPPNRPFAIWSSSPVALLTSPISYCARYLGALETPTSGTITLYVNDTQPHQLALYVCDFDKIGREETIELRNLNGHLLTPACTVNNFEDGKWLRFRFSGSIQIRLINRSSDSTAVLSALMFDKAP
jgi:D-arabinan exo alpha-(1,3)/(1,5)-arabinofuranosidase (non-reducing end)